MPIHYIDKVCSCEYCTKIDVMFGDPELNNWEKEFIESVAEQGWQRDYSDKQKKIITKTFLKMRKRFES